MTEPEAPPPSNATGGLDPYPPNPGAFPRGWQAHVVHSVLVVELAAVAALSRGSVMLLVLPALLVVAAWQAWLLARVDARHRPLAIGIGAWAALQLVARALDVTVLAEPGPYAGWARAAFHIEEAMRFATAALPAWMAARTLTRWPARVRWTWLAPWTILMIAATVDYPALRGDALRRVYLSAELAALFVAVVAILSWARRRGWRGEMVTASPGVRVNAITAAWYTFGPILALVAGDLLLLVFGAWRYGLFGSAYVVQQGGLLAVWGVVIAVQGAALVVARGRW